METKSKQEMEAEFAADPNLQREFGGSFETYLSFKKGETEGMFQTCKPGGCSMMSLEEFRDSEQLERLKGKLVKNAKELSRLGELQRKNENQQYQDGVACQV